MGVVVLGMVLNSAERSERSNVAASSQFMVQRPETWQPFASCACCTGWRVFCNLASSSGHKTLPEFPPGGVLDLRVQLP
jgi:hypothetical protein